MKAQRQKVPKNNGNKTSLHDLSSYVSEDVQVDVSTVENVVELLENDNTVPFIARYRRQETGNLEVEKIRMIQESLQNVKAVEDRKESIVKSIGDKATPEIQCSLKLARTLQDVEEIYAPFKTGSKGTLANRARKLGLDKAVEMIKANPRMTNLSMFVHANQQGLSHIKEVTKGVQHILADMTYKDREIFDITKNLFESSNVTLDTKISKNSTNDKKFKEYHQKTLSVKSIKAHQILAINRAEEGKILHVKMNCPPQVQHRYLDTASRKCVSPHSSDFVRKLMQNSLDDCYSRLMLPKLIRHKRAELTKKAERESVQVFSRNLRRLLLTPPVNGRTVMGIDPGFKHGCKIAVVNNNGVILNTDVIYPFSGKQQVAEAKLQGLLTTHNCNTIALGNGTACRETERFITKMKETGKLKKNLVYSIVSEDGASIYSVSKEAEAEMPQLDVNLRSAVSIARRLQNPLLELIKIEPKHIGVGMYQHDIPDNLLKTALSGVLEDCVSLVGVDLNASGVHVLKRISGLNERKAKEIIAWREKNGSFSNREQLKKVRGIGEKSFEQCAGFVRIVQSPSEIIVLDSDEESESNSDRSQLSGKRKAGENNIGKKKRKRDDSVAFNRLDFTCIHPESYPIAESLVALTQARLHDIGQPQMKEEMDKLLKSQGISFVYQTLKSNPATINFIISGLCQPSDHDIRADFAQPLFRQAVLSMNDIKPNDRLTGRVTNVTTFGAFVDIGVESQGLIHVSKMPANTLGVRLGVGDIVEVRLENINKTEQKIGLLLLEIKNSQAELR